MQTVINWTRYDGTPETLPEAFAHVIVAKEIIGVGHYTVMWTSCSFDMDEKEWSSHDGEYFELEVGDLWAPWPEAPEVE